MKLPHSFFCLGIFTSSASAFTGLTIFGDSLSDTGNVFAATMGTLPPAPYFQGRFSNGPIYAERLGFTITPSLAGGSNFSVGGARTITGTGNLNDQVSGFLAANSNVARSTDAYILFIGGNDVRAALNDAANAQTILSDALAGVSTNLLSLLNAGAQTVVLPNLPDFALVPEVNGLNDPMASAAASALSSQWNMGLAQIVAGANSPDVQLFDIEALFNSVATNPAAFNFTNVTDQAISSPGNDDDFFFWDAIHPTAAGHVVLAQALLDQTTIPEPTAGLLAVVGSALLFRRSRRNQP